MGTVTPSQTCWSEREPSTYRFVEPEEFLRLVVSRAVLLRSDDPVHGVRGLHDPATGVTFVVEEERVRRLEGEHAGSLEEPIGAA